MGPSPRTLHRRLRLPIALAVWFALVTIGLGAITRYSMTPGHAAVTRSDWPSEVALHPSTDRALTLVICIHEQCPCSRASLAELSKLLARHPDQIAAYVLFTRDSSSDIPHIPNVTVIDDRDGQLAKRFGARTSGQTFAFDRNGRLLFSGGITRSRGHEGANAGIDAIELILSRADRIQPASARTAVFGCPLSTRNVE